MLWLLCCARKNQFKRCCTKNPFAKATNDRWNKPSELVYKETKVFQTQNKPKQLPFISLLDETIVPGEHGIVQNAKHSTVFSGFFEQIINKRALGKRSKIILSMHTKCSSFPSKCLYGYGKLHKLAANKAIYVRANSKSIERRDCQKRTTAT